MPEQYPSPDHVILHLSDTHLVGDHELLHGAVDADAHVAALLAGLPADLGRCDAIVVTGDLADTARDDAYRRLRAALEPAAADLGAHLIWVMGNHDARPAFRRILLEADADADADVGQAPVDAVHQVGGLRIIVLDSTVPGYHHGEIDAEQRAWLSSLLATPAPHGTLLALHHPPLPATGPLVRAVELRDQHLLENILVGSDVRAILAGHLHVSTFGTFGGIPVSVAAATCTAHDPLEPGGNLRAYNGGQGFHLVHVYPDRLLHTAVPLNRTGTTLTLDAAGLAAML